MMRRLEYPGPAGRTVSALRVLQQFLQPDIPIVKILSIQLARKGRYVKRRCVDMPEKADFHCEVFFVGFEREHGMTGMQGGAALANGVDEGLRGNNAILNVGSRTCSECAHRIHELPQRSLLHQRRC